MATDISAETTKIILIALSCFWTFILTPISLYYACAIYLLGQKIPFFAKRHPKLVLISIAGMLFFVAVIRPICEYLFIYYDKGTKSISYLTLSNFLQLCFAPFVTRLWMLYYDYSHELHALNGKWRVQMFEPMVKNVKPHWTIRYKWLGNTKIILSMFTSICMTFTVMIYVFGIDGHKYTQFLPALWLIPLIVYIFKIRKCRDEFFIREEFKVVFINWMFALFSYIAIEVIFELESCIRAIIINIWICGFAHIYCFLSTFWVIRQYKLQMRQNNMINSTGYISLEAILADKDGFNVFANHLVREFSIENLAFLFEVMQIKKTALKHSLLNEEDAGFRIEIHSRVIEEVRRVSSCYGSEDLRMNMKTIMEEYIYQNAEYCVNIASFTRMDILHSYNELNGDTNENILKWISIFDDAIEEVITLLKGDSLPRFYRTKEYRMFANGNE